MSKVFRRILNNTGLKRIRNHWEGELRAAADTMDFMLEKISQNENSEPNVSKMLAKEEKTVGKGEKIGGIETEPCQ